ncbi:hypothetical protein Pmani_028113 [Petrolisthes manimaculis]|uniref:Major facilitator superfamily (MFS) profile domain-containing protein n=1 Tax=Petrolisthes manimaculis TaxID=1843537 RepID=A0AAE1TV51_9EUCA|nr:hypothetical protein Pmani_028113 [Petrolisthes manimaculis]
MESGATEMRPECMDLLEREYEDDPATKTNSSNVRVVKAGQYRAGSKQRRPKDGGRSAIVKQLLAAGFACFSSVSIGFITAYTALTLPQLRNDTSIGTLQEKDESMIASVPSIASIGGSLMGGFIMDALGPRMTLLVTALPCLLSWGFIAFANSVALIYAGRIITGIFLGIFSPVPQLYATEIAQPQIRGLLGAFPEAAVAFGSLLCYAFGAVMDWRWLAVVAALVPGIPLFLSMIVFPESPQWLTKKAKLDKAEKSLRFFRKGSHNVKAEVDSIHTNILENDGTELSMWQQVKLFKKPQNWKPVLLVFLVFMCGQFSGFGVITAYTADIFNAAGTNLDANLQTIIMGVVRFLSTILSAVLLDRVGRKPLLIISAIGSSVGMLCVGIFFYLKSNGSAEGLGLLPLTSMLIYVFFNELGYGPIPWLLSGELIPLSVRTIGNGVAVTAYSLFAFIINATFPMLTSLVHTYVVFWMYAVFSLSGVFLGMYLPETRGKTLEEIGQFFLPKKQNSPRRKTAIPKMGHPPKNGLYPKLGPPPKNGLSLNWVSLNWVSLKWVS